MHLKPFFNLLVFKQYIAQILKKGEHYLNKYIASKLVA
jgi:hypothetical protein